jgi:small subunit ribosomal protein S21e
VQINIGKVNEDGVLTGEVDTIAMCGFVRRKGLGDAAFYRVAQDKKYFAPTTKAD